MPVNALDVFVNCPFDSAYTPMFHAMVFTVARMGFRVRCAWETDDASDNRFAKICRIISESKFGIHDLSQTESDGDPPLPHFNMPFGLGLFLGAQKFGNRDQRSKRCIIYDRERHRFRRFISDIAGQDIHSHEGSKTNLVRDLTAWLRLQGGSKIGGGTAIADEYANFETVLPDICAAKRIQPDELGFPDFNEIVTQYVASL